MGRSLCLILLLLLSANVSAEELFVINLAKGASAKSPVEKVTFYPAQRAQVLRKRGPNALIRADGKDEEAWVALKYLASLSEFKAIDIWQGPKDFTVSEGDYFASYRFAADGTFKVKKLEQISDNSPAGYHYKDVHYSGKLFKKGEAVWARDSRGLKTSETVFWLLPAQLCSHVTQVCPY